MQDQLPQLEGLQDEDLELIDAMNRAARVLARLGITAEDILGELPAARADVLHRTYGSEFMQKLERQFNEARPVSTQSHAPRG